MINDFFTLDLYYYLFSTYLCDRIGFLRLVHPTWKIVIDELKLSPRSNLGVLIESDELIRYAQDHKIRITQKALIQNVKNLKLPPTQLFYEPFESFTAEFAYHYLFHQKGENGIKLMEHLLTFKQTKFLFKYIDQWKFLYSVLLIASDNVLFEWFIGKAESIFGIDIREILNNGLSWTMTPNYTADFDSSLCQRVVRSIIKFPTLKQHIVRMSLFHCNFLLFTLDQIKELISSIPLNEFPVDFFITHYFHLDFPKQQQTNEFIYALFNCDITKLKLSFTMFNELVPSDFSSLSTSGFLGYCAAFQWIEGIQYFLQLSSNVRVKMYLAKNAKIQPLRKNFWTFVEQTFSKNQQFDILEYFLFNNKVSDEMLCEMLLKLLTFTKEPDIYFLDWFPFEIIIKIINADPSTFVRKRVTQYLAFMEDFQKLTQDEIILNETKVLITRVYSNLEFFDKNNVTTYAKYSFSTNCINQLLSVDLSKRYNHNFHKETFQALLTFFNVQPKTIPAIIEMNSYSNADFLAILIPYIIITPEMIYKSTRLLCPEILDLLFDYFETNIPYEIKKNIFHHTALKFEIIKWFKDKKIIPNTPYFLENIVLFYIQKNKIELFFQDFAFELNNFLQKGHKLFENNTALWFAPLSPKVLNHLEESNCITSSFWLSFYK